MANWLDTYEILAYTDSFQYMNLASTAFGLAACVQNAFLRIRVSQDVIQLGPRSVHTGTFPL